MLDKNKIYTDCCLDCGRKYGTKNKNIFGMWKSTCTICGKENTPCASAAHDFGIYSDKNSEREDIIQDLI